MAIFCCILVSGIALANGAAASGQEARTARDGPCGLLEERQNTETPGASRPLACLFVCRGPGPTPVREVDYDFVAGWLVRPRWQRIEPEEGKYDWSYIENEIALAKRLKKKIALMVLGGPHTPEWVYQAGARRFSFTNPRAKAGSQRKTIPVLWDDVYLAKWTSLVRALGEKFSRDDTVVLVRVSGATTNGMEMQLPDRKPDLARWRQLDYSSTKVIAAWETIIDAYAAAFPNKPLDIDIHPVLESHAVAREVAAYGASKLGKRFGVFGGWLSGKSATEDAHHAAMHELARRYGASSFLDFQMIASHTQTPAEFAAGGLVAALQQGMSWGAHYFEIWEVDAMNPQLQPILRDAARGRGVFGSLGPSSPRP